nr:MAG TPA: hypothetical protein [Caudoviricetes sp.]
MNKNEILNVIAKEAVAAVKEQAAASLASLSADELRPLIMQQIKIITEPLEDEIKTTSSVWVRIRNRIYIRIINSAVDNIIQTIQDGLAELSKK